MQSQVMFLKLKVTGRRLPSDGELALAIIEKVNYNGKGLGWRIEMAEGSIDPEVHGEQRYRQGIMHGGQQAENELRANPERLHHG